jgi:hypothetical protein
MVAGRRTRVHNRARMAGVSTTYRPAYGELASVLAVRTLEGDPVSETLEAPVAGAEPQPVDLSPILTRMAAMETGFNDRFAQMAEQNRAAFTIPGILPEPTDRARRGDWMSAVLRMLSGERVNDAQMRTLADLVTTDNVGVVPPAYSNELIGVVDPSRPFLQSTRKLDLPAAGMSLLIPKIVTRPITGVQAAEKDDVASRATSITNATFDAITIAGGGDISLQLLKRSSPAYLSLFLELLAEAYGQNCEAEAVAIIIDAIGDVNGVNDGGTIDPENLTLASAWAAGATVRKRIDTIWMSSQAVGAFIDAKANDSNLPLYSTIQSGFTAGSGPAGTISGLRPVWVPALDHTVADVIVGPSSGFGWTEDGTYTLQVDVPAKAGRDVALVGIVWLALMYPTAFTAYDLAGS